MINGYNILVVHGSCRRGPRLRRTFLLRQSPIELGKHVGNLGQNVANRAANHCFPGIHAKEEKGSKHDPQFYAVDVCERGHFLSFLRQLANEKYMSLRELAKLFFLISFSRRDRNAGRAGTILRDFGVYSEVHDLHFVKISFFWSRQVVFEF